MLSARRNTALALVITAVTAVLLGASACGVRKAPRPPKPKKQARVELSGRQAGNDFVLTLKLASDTGSAGTDANSPLRADIFRQQIRSDRRRAVSQDEFASESALVASVDFTPEDRDSGKLVFIDRTASASSGQSAVYGVRLVFRSGARQPLSNLIRLDPVGNLAGAPVLNEAAVSQTAVTLAWSAPAANIDGTSPANVVGYNVYRAVEGSEDAALLTEQAVVGESYEDPTFEFGVVYIYRVTAVSLSKSGERVESRPSDAVRVEPVDVFAPEAPTAVTIAVSPRAVSIFFPANIEKDVVGYIIHRSENSDIPLGEWKPLNEAPLTTTTFDDDKVESGRSYFYYVVAVDRAGNRSAPSEVVTETVP
jgi:hypothetical protein